MAPRARDAVGGRDARRLIGGSLVVIFAKFAPSDQQSKLRRPLFKIATAARSIVSV